MKFKEMTEEEQLDYVRDLELKDFKIQKCEDYGHRITVNEGNFNFLMIFAAMSVGKAKFYDEDGRFRHTSKYECRGCGTYFEAEVTIDFDEKTVAIKHTQEVAQSDCIKRLDQNVFNLSITCPSGKLVFGNDLRYIEKFHPVNKISRDIDINYKGECIRSMELYASYGLIYLQCGNDCPSVYKLPDGNILVGDVDEYDFDTGEHTMFPEYEGSEHLGGICTDLWAVHAIDYDVYMKYQDELDDDHFIVDVSHLGTELNVEYHYNFGRGSNVLGKITGKK